MSTKQIFQHFLSIEINRRGLPYKTAINQTALAREVSEREVEQIVLDHATDLELSAQELEWMSFPKAIIDAALTGKKPNWTPLELNEKHLRWTQLGDETSAHDDCDCNRCMEHFGLSHQLAGFTEDEMATAVIELNKLQETK